MQMSRLMVWSTAFSDDERSETEYRLSADETPLTLSGLPPENRDNSRDNIRTKHFIIAKIHIFTQRSKRNQHRNRSGTCPSGTDKPPGKATINATLRCKIVAGQAAHKLADALPADIRKSGHGQQSVAPLAALAPQLPAHRAGLSPTAPRGHNRPGAAVPARASVPRIRVH